MPTEAERGGDLSQTLNQLASPVVAIDPITGAPFPGNMIPVTRIAPQAQALLSYYPLPNFNPSVALQLPDPAGGYGRFRLPADAHQQDYQPEEFGERQFRLPAHQRGQPESLPVRGRQHHLGDESQRELAAHLQQDASSEPWERSTAGSRRATRPSSPTGSTCPARRGSRGNNQDPVNWGPPALNFSSGFAALSDGQQSFTRNQTSAISLFRDVAEAAAQHHHRRRHPAHADSICCRSRTPRGNFGFTGAATQATDDGVGVPGTGSDFADFLLGVPGHQFDRLRQCR